MLGEVTASIQFFLPMPAFTWRETVKTHKGRCPKRGHCTVTKTGGIKPETKGNRERIITIGKGPAARSSITPSNRTRAGEAAIVKALRARPERPERPIEADVTLDVMFCFEVPKGWPAWRKEAALAGAIHPTGGLCGDRGNLLKMIEDALASAGYYTDDAHVFCGAVGKFYSVKGAGYVIQLAAKRTAPRTAKEWNARR